MIDLKGTWQFRLDRDDRGRIEHWESKNLGGRITIPGILQSQGYGDDITEHTDWVQTLYDRLWYQREEYRYGQEERTRVPFLCQPPKHYTGKAWYRRPFTVSEAQSKKWLMLYLECARWKTEAWIDGNWLGEQRSLCAPHEFTVGRLSPGEHWLTICEDNGWLLPYRPDGHGVSDGLGATWNGLVGEVKITESPLVLLKRVRIFTDAAQRRAVVEAQLESHLEQDSFAVLTAEDGDGLTKSGQSVIRKAQRIEIHPGESRTERLELEYPSDAGLWDEFLPALHQVRLGLKVSAPDMADLYMEQTHTFGFRDIKAENGMFYVNGRPTYFRGTHFGGDYPLTGYPSCEPEFWDRLMGRVKEWGLNYIRFHSYCPPDAAFAAADRAGVYLQAECGMWNSFWDGCSMNEVLKEETEKILDAFGNHPSFVMLSPSNEPGGDWYSPLSAWVKEWKEKDGRRLYTAQSGWPYPMPPDKITGTDYAYFHRSGYGMEAGGSIRGYRGWHGGDYRKALEGIRCPVICHEMGQWCAYPDFKIADKFKGYLYPGSYLVYKENAAAHGVLGQNQTFAWHSGRLQAAMYKEDLEANCRTPHIYGYELLDLHDYLGQGSALVGVLDAFWDPKGYITASEWRHFCNETVVLARLPKRVYTVEEQLACSFEICHFGRDALRDESLWWRLVRTDRETEETVVCGQFECGRIPLGKNFDVGEISVTLADKGAPGSYRLEAGLIRSGFSNSWDIWLFEPAQEETDAVVEEAEDLLITDSWDKTFAGLKEGKKVLFLPDPAQLSYDCPRLSYRPVFWNAQMGPTWARGMGLVCDPKHPALAGFPTESWADWQWEEIMTGARGFRMEHLPEEVQNIVQPIDDWNRNYKLSLLFECRVGKGRLLAASADLKHRLKERPAANALRNSLIAYMKSDAFRPLAYVTEEALARLQFPAHVMEQLSVCAVCEEAEDADTSAMLDGNPDTFFRLEGEYPLHIRLIMREPHRISGLIYVPRQNHRDHEGDMKGYRIEVWSDSGWITAAEGELASSFDPKTVMFGKSVTTDRVRLTVLSGFEAKDRSCWKQLQDGWYRVDDSGRPQVFAAAVLAFICEETLEEWKDGSAAPVQEVASATKEIEQ